MTNLYIQFVELSIDEEVSGSLELVSHLLQTLRELLVPTDLVPQLRVVRRVEVRGLRGGGDTARVVPEGSGEVEDGDSGRASARCRRH